jgi:pilus assembly protein CpaB
MSVRVNDVINVAGYVVAGTRVDLLVTVKDENPTSGPKEAMARIVLSNLIVLTAGTRYDTEKGKDGKPQPSTVITLAVLPEDAEKVALAQSEGKLSLALRNPLDVDQTKTSGIKLAELMRAGAAPSPVINPVTRKAAPRPRPVAPTPVVAPPPVVYRVEAFRGIKRTEEVVN